jgi:drug/metabolite transporter (DMT)-like permease
VDANPLAIGLGLFSALTLAAPNMSVKMGTDILVGRALLVAAGALSVFSFDASLFAMSLIEAARVSTLRETSVVLAAAMGALFLGEGFGRRRIAAAFGLAVGPVLMQFGG